MSLYGYARSLFFKYSSQVGKIKFIRLGMVIVSVILLMNAPISEFATEKADLSLRIRYKYIRYILICSQKI